MTETKQIAGTNTGKPDAPPPSNPKIVADNPIENSSEDKLKRVKSAEDFVTHLFDMDLSKGFVASIYGEWGSGKTSFLNLVKGELRKKMKGIQEEKRKKEEREKGEQGESATRFNPWMYMKKSIWKEKRKEEEGEVPIIDFNPWIYSKEGNISKMFFNEISAEIKSIEFSRPDSKINEELSELLKNIGTLLTGNPILGEILSKIISHKVANNLNLILPPIVIIISLLYYFDIYSWFQVLSTSSELMDNVILTVFGILFASVVSLLILNSVQYSKYGSYDIDLFPVRYDSIREYREKIEKILTEYFDEENVPIVVIIDDIDRLHDDEIREVFKLVRNTARFPYIVYIIACDRKRVEGAFKDKGYVDKIIQLPYELPTISKRKLDCMVQCEIKNVFTNPENSQKIFEGFPGINEKLYQNIIGICINNLRDLYRYRAAITGAITTYKGTVCLKDVYALEAIRIFKRDIYENIRREAAGLTVEYDRGNYPEIEGQKSLPIFKERSDRIKILERRVSAKDRNSGIINAICDYLFTSDSQKDERRKDICYKQAVSEVTQFRCRRVAHKHILEYYLQEENEELLYFEEAKNIFNYIKHNENLGELKNKLDSVEPNHEPKQIKKSIRLANVIGCLRYFDEDFAQVASSEKVKEIMGVLWKIVNEWPCDDSLYFNVKMITFMLLYHLKHIEKIIESINQTPFEDITYPHQMEIISLSETQIERLLRQNNYSDKMINTRDKKETINGVNRYRKNLRKSFLEKIELNPAVLVNDKQLFRTLDFIIGSYNELCSPEINSEPLFLPGFKFKYISLDDSIPEYRAEIQQDFKDNIAFRLEEDVKLLQSAVTNYRESLEVEIQKKKFEKWAAIQHTLGITLALQGLIEDRPELFAQAVIAYHHSLEVYTQEKYPRERAMVQYRLGLTLATWGEIERKVDLFREAVIAYNASLKGHTWWKCPQEWATIQCRLGFALAVWGKLADKPRLLEEAEAAYRASLKERTREKYPQEWAELQYGLGFTLTTQGKLQKNIDFLKQAVTAFRASLEVYTQRSNLRKWAISQRFLGTTLEIWGQLGGGSDSFKQAVMTYRDSLQLYSQEIYPQEWATIQNKLGIVLAICGQWNEISEFFEQAVISHNAATEACIREERPLEWAAIQHNIGVNFATLGRLKNNKEILCESIKYLSASHEEFNQTIYSEMWAESQYHLGIVYLMWSNMTHDYALLKQSVAAFRNALKEYTQESYPKKWAATQYNLGNVFLIQGRIENRIELFGQAKIAFERVLKVYTEEEEQSQYVRTRNNLDTTFAIHKVFQRRTNLFEQIFNAHNKALKKHAEKEGRIEWAQVQHNLGVFHMVWSEIEEETDKKSEQLQEAEMAFKEALKVYNQKKHSKKWAETQYKLGIVHTNRSELAEETEKKVGQLQKAEKAFREALKVYNQEKHPKEWAEAQRNLEIVLEALESLRQTEEKD